MGGIDAGVDDADLHALTRDVERLASRLGAEVPVGRVHRGPHGKVLFHSEHAGRLGQNYHIYGENKDLDGISSITLRYYGDDSLHGYGAVEFTRADGRALVDQQRSIVIPLVAAAIDEDRPKLVLEIGTGNGDVIAHLAGLNGCRGREG